MSTYGESYDQNIDIGIYLNFSTTPHYEVPIVVKREEPEAVRAPRLPIKRVKGPKSAPAIHGRWKYDEHLIYLEVIRERSQQREVINELSRRLPDRSMTQIRAHHQKMLNKFQNTKEILKFYPCPEYNGRFKQMTDFLEEGLRKIGCIKENLTGILSSF